MVTEKKEIPSSSQFRDSKAELPDEKRLEELESQYDPEMNFRPVAPWLQQAITWALVGLGFYHFYTAGFGIPREQWHKGIHLAAVLGLIFLCFELRRSSNRKSKKKYKDSYWRSANLGLDIRFSCLGCRSLRSGYVYRAILANSDARNEFSDWIPEPN